MRRALSLSFERPDEAETLSGRFSLLQIFSKMTDMLSARISARIAEEITARPSQVEAAVRLLDEGATVPFIARYRKEMTGGLTDAQLRTLEERLVYLR